LQLFVFHRLRQKNLVTSKIISKVNFKKLIVAENDY
jgi:hypothetical protein